ncbi:MAG: hypothetical protein GY832_08330 [Chloroflexi bacterium]|nr:hypothetical protein [Chloroflexota bacterium]
MILDELQIADGQIVEIHSTREVLVVAFCDWQEQKWQLLFSNVVGIEAFSPEGEDLAGVEIEEDNELTRKAWEVTAEDDSVLRCYIFTSAWSGNPVLRVVATVCQVKQL